MVPPQVIKLMPEYAASLPLWDERGNLGRSGAQLPPALLDRLEAWQREFEENFRWDTGWQSAAAREHWAGQAPRLEAALRDALSPRTELVVDLWPLGGGPEQR
jgi:hypothetical protein